MDFSVPEDTRILVNSVKKFIEKEIHPIEEKFKDADEIPYEQKKEIIRKSKEAGFWGADMPEELGGGGLSHLAMEQLLEEVGKNTKYLSWFYIFGGPIGPSKILMEGSDYIKNEFLKPTIEAKKIACFALTEPGAGSDARSIKAKAERNKNGWVINGTKHFITGAPYADYAITFAKTNSGISCFVVEKFKLGKVQKGMGEADTGEIIFEDIKIPPENLIGEEGKGLDYAKKWLASGRLYIAANSIGVAEKLFKIASEYARERKAFGRRIYEFQGISFPMAELRAQIDAVKLLVRYTAWKLDGGERAILEASEAKLLATEVLWRMADLAVQIHGGTGYMREFVVEKIFRWARAMRIVEGTSEIQKLIISREIFR